MTNDVIWASEQERQKVRKVKKTDSRGGGSDRWRVTTSPIRWRAPAECTKTKFGMRGHVADVIICFKFYRNRLWGFRAVMGQKWGYSIDFNSRPYNRSALPCCLWCKHTDIQTVRHTPRVKGQSQSSPKLRTFRKHNNAYFYRGISTFDRWLVVSRLCADECAHKHTETNSKQNNVCFS